MTLPPELDVIWRGNPPASESLIMATYIAGMRRAAEMNSAFYRAVPAAKHIRAVADALEWK